MGGLRDYHMDYQQPPYWINIILPHQGHSAVLGKIPLLNQKLGRSVSQRSLFQGMASEVSGVHTFSWNMLDCHLEVSAVIKRGNGKSRLPGSFNGKKPSTNGEFSIATRDYRMMMMMMMMTIMMMTKMMMEHGGTWWIVFGLGNYKL